MAIIIDFYLRCRLDINFVTYLGKMKYATALSR